MISKKLCDFARCKQKSPLFHAGRIAKSDAGKGGNGGSADLCRIIIVATKTDKLKRSELKPAMKKLRDLYSLSEDEVLIPFSSETKAGRDELWSAILAD